MGTHPDITDETLIAEIMKLAAESPDFVYEAPAHMTREYEYTTECFYVHTDPDGDDAKNAPGCIVGQALHRLGVPLSVLEQYEHVGAGTLVSEITPNVGAVGESFARRAQLNQDEGKTWRDAVDHATEYVLG